jgi:hypothetical protein
VWPEATGSNRNLVPQSELGQILGQDEAHGVGDPDIPWLGAWTPQATGGTTLGGGPSGHQGVQVGNSNEQVWRELRERGHGRSTTRPDFRTAARGRARTARCASGPLRQPTLHTCLRCGSERDGRRSGAPFCSESRARAQFCALGVQPAELGEPPAGHAVGSGCSNAARPIWRPGAEIATGRVIRTSSTSLLLVHMYRAVRCP